MIEQVFKAFFEGLLVVQMCCTQQGMFLVFVVQFEMLFYLYFILKFADPPSLTAQPKRKIFAELDRNVDIPCLATGTLSMCVCDCKHT